MAFFRIRTIRDRRYLYREERWREGKRVRSRSTYIGPADGYSGVGGILRRIGDQLRVEPGSSIVDEMLAKGFEQAKEREGRQVAAEKAFYEDMHERFGMAPPVADPVPIEKTPSAEAKGAEVTPSSSAEAPPSGEDGTEAAASPQ